MLKLGGYLNILIAVMHIVGLIWIKEMFEVTGIDKEMSEVASIHFMIPYMLTIFVAIFFFIFGLYGLSGANTFRELPFLKHIILIISIIYLLRGIGGLLFDFVVGDIVYLQTFYSLMAVFIGLLYLFGGLKRLKVRNAS